MMIRKLVLLFFLLGMTQIYPAFRIFVFNPESQISRGRYIKKIFESQCRKLRISCEMQLFAKSVDFDRIVRNQESDLAIVASYYFTFKKKEFKWSPILAGYRGRSAGFKKGLYARGSRSLSRIRYISTVALGPNAINPVERRLINSMGRNRVFVTTVSKEIDAIMGLALSQVDGAIVSRRTVRLLRRINPRIARPLRAIRTLPIVPYPKVVVFPFSNKKENSIKEVKRVLKSFKKGSRTGKFFFRYFGVTEFR